jgi:hypothetical protein
MDDSILDTRLREYKLLIADFGLVEGRRARTDTTI